MSDDRDPFLGRALWNFQQTVRRSGPAAAASYALIGAIALCGGLGYLADRWLGTWPWLLVSGLVFGLVVGFYQLAKTVWPK